MCEPGMTAPSRDGEVSGLLKDARRGDFGYLTDEVLHAWPGPEWEMLSQEARLSLLSSAFSVHPDSNRMAVRLDPAAPSGTVGAVAEILTGPVQPGSVQWTPSGRVLVLMRDAQTTGGYARILQLGERALHTLGQRRPGTSVRLRLDPGEPWRRGR
jgi:allophanate hydrolase subunit 2